MVMLTLGETRWKVYGEALYYFLITLLQVYKFKSKKQSLNKTNKSIISYITHSWMRQSLGLSLISQLQGAEPNSITSDCTYLEQVATSITRCRNPKIYLWTSYWMGYLQFHRPTNTLASSWKGQDLNIG